MTSAMHPRDCPACGVVRSSALETVDLDEQHGFYAPGNSSVQQALTAAARQSAPGYAMWRCAVCNLEWADPMRAPSDGWYALAYETLDLYPGTRWEFEHVLAACSRRDTVFDIGCGSGSFLKLCWNAGICGQGADFAAEPVRKCVQAGLNVRQVNVDWDPSKFAGSNATVVTAFQVLEHLGEPARLFELASTVSAREGTLWVAVPSHRRPSRLFNERDYLDQPPHHLTRWSEESLAALGERCGWQLEELAFEPLPLSSALWWISTENGLYKRLLNGKARGASAVERMVRWMNYPAALALRGTRYRAMTGFSMLGRFRRSPAKRATADS